MTFANEHHPWSLEELVRNLESAHYYSTIGFSELRIPVAIP